MGKAREEEVPLKTAELVEWTKRLEELAALFRTKGDLDNSKMMGVCSMLMAKLTADVNNMNWNPFPTEQGRA